VKTPDLIAGFTQQLRYNFVVKVLSPNITIARPRAQLPLPN